MHRGLAGMTFWRMLGLFALWSALCPGMAHAQQRIRFLDDLSPDMPEFETDRDAFTPATRPVMQGMSVLESSYSYIDNSGSADTHSFPELLWRYGALPGIELRLGWNYEIGGGGNVISNNEGAEGLFEPGINRESRFLYGLKTKITDQSGWIPRSALIVEAFTPTSGEAKATQLATTYTYGWELPNQWRLDSAMRFATGREDGAMTQRWAPSVVLRVPLDERWQVHAEYFGNFSQGGDMTAARAFFSPGGHFMLTPNVELGLRVGWGITQQAAPFFANVGFGVRY